MLILIDQDGVLADFHTGFTETWMRLHPQYPAIPLEQRRHFHMRDEYPAHLGAEVERIYTAEGFFRDLPPLPGAIAGVYALLEAGHDVRICSSPLLKYHHCLYEKYEWIERHFGKEFVPNMILTRDKTLVHGDALIDDNPSIFGFHKPSWRRVIFDQPYNRQLAGLRMDWSNWREILPRIDKERDHGHS